jgi:hypothetical protein
VLPQSNPCTCPQRPNPLCLTQNTNLQQLTQILILKANYSTLGIFYGFQASVEFCCKPRRISPNNPTWHPLRIKFPTEISKIPNNSFRIKSLQKSDHEFERIDQRSVCSHCALCASPQLSDVAYKKHSTLA